MLVPDYTYSTTKSAVFIQNFLYSIIADVLCQCESGDASRSLAASFAHALFEFLNHQFNGSGGWGR